MISKFQNYLEISKICDEFGINNWKISKNDEIDVDGDVDLVNRNLEKIPLKFGTVTGNFDVEINILNSLDGSPKIVGGDFGCSKNKLKSLEGSPKIVGGDFFCEDNDIYSFRGIWEDSLNLSRTDKGWGFFCHGNPIFQIWCLINSPESIYLINEFGVIDGDKIIWDRLMEVYHTLGYGEPDIEIVKRKLKSYKIIF